MKRNRLSMLGAGFAMALAGLMGTAQATQPVLTHHEARSSDYKDTGAKHTQKAGYKEQTIGGIPLATLLPDYGMSPKEYGMRYGHGNGSGRGNRLRLSHDAKLKRRTV